MSVQVSSCHFQSLPLLPRKKLEVFRGLHLDLASQRIEADKEIFPCCEGRGCRVELKTRTSIFCELSRRKKLIQMQYDEFKIWYPDLNVDLSEAYLATFSSQTSFQYLFENLSDLSCPTRGRLFTDSGGPMSLFLWVMAELWLNGTRILLINFHKESQADITKKLMSIKKDNEFIGLAVIGVSHLWDATNNDQFSRIVSVAYHSLKPLWIHLDEKKSSATSQKEKPIEPRSSIKSFVKSRVNSIKSRDLSSWLSRDDYARLGSVCDL